MITTRMPVAFQLTLLSAFLLQFGCGEPSDASNNNNFDNVNNNNQTGPECGDGVHDAGETCVSCPADVPCAVGTFCEQVAETCEPEPRSWMTVDGEGVDSTTVHFTMTQVLVGEDFVFFDARNGSVGTDIFTVSLSDFDGEPVVAGTYNNLTAAGDVSVRVTVKLDGTSYTADPLSGDVTVVLDAVPALGEVMSVEVSGQVLTAGGAVLNVAGHLEGPRAADSAK
jgi:hypothetical protein